MVLLTMFTIFKCSMLNAQSMPQSINARWLSLLARSKKKTNTNTCQSIKKGTVFPVRTENKTSNASSQF